MHIKEMSSGAIYDMAFHKQEGHERRACPACNPEKEKNLPFGFNHDQGIGYCHKCEGRFKGVRHGERADTKDAQDHKPLKKEPNLPSTISYEVVSRTLQVERSFEYRLQTNSFLRFLANHFGRNTAKRLADFYLIGTSREFGGSPVFWQIDHDFNVRSGKIIGYNSDTGKRLNYMTWVHAAYKAIDKRAFNLSQCLFGAHLIPDSEGPFAIVESEKTAVIASYYLPEYTWLATGGKSNLKAEKLSPLKDYPVILYPDLNAADEWEEQIRSLKGHFKIEVLRFLEQTATTEEKQQGLDLADYLLRDYPAEHEKSFVDCLEHPIVIQRPSAEPVSDGKAESEPQVPDTSNFRKAKGGYLEPVTEAGRAATYHFFLAKNCKLAYLFSP